MQRLAFRRARLSSSRRLFRLPLTLELLEDRNVLSAGGLFGGVDLRTDFNDYIPERVVIQVRPGDLDGPTALSFGDLGAATTTSLGGDFWRVDLPAGVTVEKAVGIYEQMGDVALAQPDYIVHADRLPNDPSFGTLYGLNNTGQSGGTADADIDAPEAWDVSTGSGNFVVAIIDTGVDYNHPDLAANMWHNAAEPIDGIDNDGNGIIDDHYGANFVPTTPTGDPLDDNNHGTHVAGTIGAIGNNGVGVTGVNWHVKIMALKFLNASGSGATSGAISALNYAVAHGVKVSNNSWGGGGYSSGLFNAINAARTAGHVFVAAAGNAGTNNDTTPSYPASYNLDNVIAVAATDRNDNLASFSQYGATSVDLAAPGVSILSTTRNNTYSTFSGTSMATPHVAGAIALAWDAHPEWTAADVRTNLLASVDVKASLAGKVATGGRLNLRAFIGAQPPADTSGPKVSAAVPSGAAANTYDKIRVTFDEAINAGTLNAVDDIVLTGPGGGIAITGITPVGTDNKVFDVTFTAQSAAGTYTFTLGPNVTDTAGNLMNQDGDSTNGENPADAFSSSFALSSTITFTVNPNITIRDLRTTNSTMTVNTTPNVTIGDLNVRINLTHTYDGDLRITLIAPDGTSRILVNRRGGAGDNFTNTVFDDEASASITAGAAPFSGTYRPEALLAGFEGKTVNGTWTLRIEDLASLDTGRLLSWSLIVTPDNSPATFGSGDGFAAPTIGLLFTDLATSRSLFADVRREERAVVAVLPPAVAPTPTRSETLRIESVLDRFYAGEEDAPTDDAVAFADEVE